ncbi:MAG: 50S ribosomal protein L10 [Terriglobales bacterium]
MAVTRAKKIEQVEELSQDMKQATTAILATFSGLKAAQTEDLRKTVRNAGAKFQVVKNTLAERAAQGTALEQVLKDLTGVTSIAYTTGDPVTLAKVLQKYVKDNPEMKFKVGVVEGRVIQVKEIEALATMPSKEEIFSKLLFLINAPAQRLVTVMGAVGRDLAVVVNQGVKENKFAGGEAVAEAVAAGG